MIYFLDYYHPFAGLCNQLYLITNHINECYQKGATLFIHKFNIDIFKKERVPIDQVLNISKTNENLKRILNKEILIQTCPETVEHIPKLCIYPVSSIQILNCLEFNTTIMEKVNVVKGNLPIDYHAIHFRLDIDAVLHYTFGKEVYTHFMDLANIDELLAMEYFTQLDTQKIEGYCSFLMQEYFNFILQFGFSKVWYISTSITKWKIHDPMIPFLKTLTDFILHHGGTYFISAKIYPQRELNALVDLLILRDSTKLIGFEGSSFSEGYIFKVNSVRNPNKEYLFVKEYP